jgi:hypothetical protein
MSSTQFDSGSATMNFVSGTTWTATLIVDMTFAPSSPYYGTMNWSVIAVDGSPNQNQNPTPVSSLTTVDVPFAQGGCP